MTTKTRPQRARVATLVIWSLFSVALIGSVALGALATPASAGTTLGSTSSTTTSTTTTTYSTSTTQPLSSILSSNQGAAVPDPTPINCPAYGSSTLSCMATYRADPTGLLPAWRWWSSAIVINTAPGSNPVADAFMEGADFTSTVLFGIASVIWLLLLGIIKYALDLSLVAAAGNSINRGFAWLSSSITSSGILILVLAFAFIVAFRMFLRGNVHKLLSLALVVIIPVATMWTLADIINSNTQAPTGPNQDTTITPGVGTPAWLALEGTSTIDSIAGTLATGFGTLAPSTLSTPPATTLNCDSYVDALYGEYNSFNTTDVQNNTTNAPFDASTWSADESAGPGLALDPASNVALTASSELWQQAYLNNWVAAQYGSYTQGEDIYCRQLESSAGISPFEQTGLTKVAALYNPGGANATPPIASTVFYLPPNAPADVITATYFAFAACTYDSSTSSFTYANDWQYFDSAGSADAASDCDTVFNANSSLYSGTNSASGGSGGGIISGIIHGGCSFLSDALPGSCGVVTGIVDTSNNVLNTVIKLGTNGLNSCGSTVASCDGTIPYLNNMNSNSSLSSAYSTAAKAAPASATAQIGLDYHTLTSYWGQNETYSLLDSFLALLTAVIYAYAIGALALGCVLAQVGLVIMLLLLPATLLLLAIPTKEGGRVRSGVTLLRTTLGFIVSKGVLSIVLVIMLEMILWIQQLVNAGTGPLQGVVHAIIPLVVLYLVKKILSAVGMPNLTSLQGAIAMPTAAAMAMSGSARANSAVMGGLSKALGTDEVRDKNGNITTKSRGLNRWDKGLKAPTSRTRRLLGEKYNGIEGDATHLGAKKAVAGFFGLDQMRAQLFGVRDPKTDKLIAPGYLARPDRLAGFLDLSANGRLRQGAAKAFGTDPKNPNLEPGDPTLGLGSRAFNATDEALSQRKALMKATRFKSTSQRLAIMSEMAEEDAQLHIVQRHALRAKDGRIVTDLDGRAVFAWKQITEQPLHHVNTIDPKSGKMINEPVYEMFHKKEDGTAEVIDLATYQRLLAEDPNSVTTRSTPKTLLLGQKEADALPEDVRSRLKPVLSYQETYSPERQFARNTTFMDRLHLRENQASLSILGFDGIINPQLAAADGRNRLLSTKAPEGDALAALYAINYIDNEVKQRRPGATDEEHTIYLNTLNKMIGGVDPNGNVIDYPARYNIDVFSPSGQAEIDAEHAGLPSAFDRVKVYVAPEVERAARASAKEMARGSSGKEMRQNIDIIWGEESEKYITQARARAAAGNDNAARMDALRADVRTISMNLGTARIKYAAAQTAETELPDLQLELRRLQAQLATAAPDAPDTAEITESVKKLTERIKAASEQVATAPSLAEKVEQFDSQFRDIARQIAKAGDDSVQIDADNAELTEAMEYMFEMAQAAQGKKGRKGTNNIGALVDMKDVAEKIRMGNTTALRSQFDTLNASITQMLTNPDGYDPIQLEALVTAAAKKAAEVSRARTNQVQDAIGLQDLIIAKFDKAEAALGKEPRRPTWTQ